MGEAIGPTPPSPRLPPGYATAVVTVLHFIITHIYFFPRPYSDKYGHELALARHMFASGPGSLVMALDGSKVLRFVPPAPKMLAEIRMTILHCLLPLILRLKLSHNAI